MRSVYVGVVGSVPSPAVGARFERSADGGLVLREVAPLAVGVPSADSVSGRGRRSWRSRLFGRPRFSPGLSEWLVALPATTAVLRRVLPPSLPTAQREKLLAFEARQLLPVGPAEAVWATAEFLPGTGGPAAAIVAAARREAVEAALADHLGAGRPVGRLEPRGMAVYRCFRYNYPEASSGASALIDLGGGNLTVMLADAGSFALRTTRVASAEKAGTAPPWPLAGAADGRTMAERIHLELARLLAAREAGSAGELRTTVERLFFVGDDPTHAMLERPLEERLGLALERLEPLRRVALAPAAERAAGNPSLVEWVGLAAPPSTEAPVLDLTPAAWRAGREARARRPVVRAAMAAALLAPVPPGVLGWNLARDEVRAREQSRRDLASLAPLMAREAAARDELRRVEADALRWRDLTTDRHRWLGLLDDLQARLSDGHRLSFEAMELLPASQAGDEAAAPRLRLAGRLAPSEGLAEPASARGRIGALFDTLRGAPWCRAIEQERFDPGERGGMRFEAVLRLTDAVLP